MFHHRCLNRLRAPNLLPTSCYKNTNLRQPPVVHLASIASTCDKHVGDCDDPNLCSLLLIAAASIQIPQIQTLLSAVGDQSTTQQDKENSGQSRSRGKPFREKGPVPRLKETEQEESRCHWTAHLLPVTRLSATSQSPALPV